MNITGHEVEKVEDTTGILSGDRYEFFINIEVDEDDELYSEQGLYIKAIFAIVDNDARIIQYNIYEKTTNKYFDLALEEDEEEILLNYCKQHLQ